MPSTTAAARLPGLALIGCGAIAERYYLPALARRPDAMRRLVLVDCNGERAQEMAQRFGAARYAREYRDVLDAVAGAIVAVPTCSHFPIVMDLLARGVHVLCEKPLAESADHADQMVALARQTRAALALNHQLRVYPNLAQVKALIGSGGLGAPVAMRYSVGSQFDWPSLSGFYFDPAQACGGVLRDLGAHVLDVVCWWLDAKPRLVSSQNDSFGGNEAVARVRFEHDRCRGEVFVSWLARLPGRFAVELEGGTIWGDVSDLRRIAVRAGSGQAKTINLRSGPRSYPAVASTIVDNFLAVVAGREDPLVSGAAVLDSIEFIDACYRAATRFAMPWYDVLV